MMVITATMIPALARGCQVGVPSSSDLWKGVKTVTKLENNIVTSSRKRTKLKEQKRFLKEVQELAQQCSIIGENI